MVACKDMASRGQHTRSGTSVVLCLLQGQILPLNFLSSHLFLLACFVLFCCFMTITEIMDKILCWLATDFPDLLLGHFRFQTTSDFREFVLPPFSSCFPDKQLCPPGKA